MQWQVHNRGDAYAERHGLADRGEAVGAYAFTRFKSAEEKMATSGDQAGEVPESLRETEGSWSRLIRSR